MNQHNRPKKIVERSYLNREFMESTDARSIRILSEYYHPMQVFRKRQVHDTIVFFGSARAKSPRDLRKLGIHEGDGIQHKLSKYYVEACRLSYRLTKWSKALPAGSRQFLVISGGGGGIMEAANRGAYLARGKSIGLNISLPFEQTPNKYITHSLSFDFNYFFMRKYWFTYLAKALIIFPGGFGTVDELFELLTLKQTHKMEKPLPIVIYGSEYWKDLINFDKFIEWETISKEDMEYVHFSDNVDDAFDYLTKHITELYLKPGKGA
ncbi:MAG: LOG family protein [Spirochaetia bacterium]|nr:LOG family protein [Spirochaetia bacterium]